MILHLKDDCRVKYKSGNLIRGIVVVLYVLVFIVLPSYAAESEILDKVRVGIYFNYDRSNIKTAVSRLDLKAPLGVEVGFVKADEFVKQYVNSSDKSISICKEGYSKGIYHIRIGGNLANIEDANALIDKLKNSQVKAYLAYVDDWQVWTGSYDTLTDALKSIVDLKAKYNQVGYNVVLSSSNRIVGLVDNDIVLAFDSLKTALRVRPASSNNPYALTINNNSKEVYRGEFEFKRLTGSDMTIVNELPLEEYLYGVLPYEIGSGAPMEALKAQAVAARTYTINNRFKYKSLGFNLCNTTASQVYKGMSGETQNTNKAVDDTKGGMVYYNGSLAQVYYFSSSGGMTEDVKNVWGSNIPYLKSVEDKYESGKSWNYNWELSYTQNDIKNFLSKKNIDIGEIIDIKITNRSQAGRATEMIVYGTKGSYSFKNEGCRTAFNLSSQNFVINTDTKEVLSIKTATNVYENTFINGRTMISAGGIKSLIPLSGSLKILSANDNKKDVSVNAVKVFNFIGKGWGHAVGMSQDGAMGMAKAGFNYEDILKHYFQGTEILKKN